MKHMRQMFYVVGSKCNSTIQINRYGRQLLGFSQLVCDGIQKQTPSRKALLATILPFFSSMLQSSANIYILLTLRFTIFDRSLPLRCALSSNVGMAKEDWRRRPVDISTHLGPFLSKVSLALRISDLWLSSKTFMNHFHTMQSSLTRLVECLLLIRTDLGTRAWWPCG